MKNNNIKNNQAGFLQIIALIIVFVFVAIFFGKNPLEIWTQYIEPVVRASFLFLLQAINFLIVFITDLMK